MSNRTVNCCKLMIEAEGLQEPPFPGELGKEIFEKVSKAAWLEWRDNIQIKVINEYRLNLVDSDHFQILVEQLRAFLNLDTDGQMLEIENEERGRKGI